jgi:hypothetical protein
MHTISPSVQNLETSARSQQAYSTSQQHNNPGVYRAFMHNNPVHTHTHTHTHTHSAATVRRKRP